MQGRLSAVESDDTVREEPNAYALNADAGLVARCFDRLPFELHHDLISSGLFTLPSLAATAEKMIAMGLGRRVVIFQGTERSQMAGANFDDMKARKPSQAALSNLERSNCWIDLINVNEADSKLDALRRSVLGDLERLLGARVLGSIRHCQMNVFLASPGLVTPYHFDHGHNFLLQIAGEKEVWLWDPADRQNLPETQIERFYFAEFPPARKDLDFARGKMFKLRPGSGVYQPSLAPHWITNGPNISISVSISFSTTDLYRRVRVYQANKMLRSIGLKPRPPGRSRVLDGLRSAPLALFGDRSPSDMNDALYSGIKRLRNVTKLLKRSPFRSRTMTGRAG